MPNRFPIQVALQHHGGHINRLREWQRKDSHLLSENLDIFVMMSVEINNIILESLKQYNPLFIGLFGSYARNEQTAKSDIDILVSFQKGISLLGLIRLENELSAKLGRQVDLITLGAIKNKRIKDSISHDLQIIFQA